VINYSDFVAHRPLGYTRSRVLSAVVSIGYHVVYGYAMARAFGLGFTLAALVLFVPHAGFWLDRLRQYTEHNLMPLENNRGSRSFGTGFWGLLIGGGPWGSPCHWEHHLVASLPWYQQLILHRDLKRTLTPSQRAQYLLEPVFGYPKLLWRIWRESARFQRASRTS
jgi:fatty acid desaturase